MFALLATAMMLGCTDAPTGPLGDRTAASAPEPVDDPQWRFVDTLERHLPSGAVAEPVLELSSPRRRTSTILAAVLREGSADVRIERWTFQRTRPLRLADGGQVLVRLAPGPRHSDLVVLRRQLAAPAVEVVRPRGLSVSTPRLAVAALVGAFGTLRDPSAEARTRVEAAATVVRALGDGIVFERDAIWELAALLETAPTAVAVHPRSPLRVTAVLEVNHRAITLELRREAHGWLVSDFRASGAPVPRGRPSETIAHADGDHI